MLFTVIIGAYLFTLIATYICHLIFETDYKDLDEEIKPIIEDEEDCFEYYFN